MSTFQARLHRIRLVATHTVRSSIRSGGGVIFILVAFYLTLYTPGMFVIFAELGANEDITEILGIPTVQPEQAIQGYVNNERVRECTYWLLGTRHMSDGFTDEDESILRKAQKWRSFLFEDHPALLTLFMLMYVYLLPGTVRPGCRRLLQNRSTTC